jgi:hypothetical protein
LHDERASFEPNAIVGMRKWRPSVRLALNTAKDAHTIEMARIREDFPSSQTEYNLHRGCRSRQAINHGLFPNVIPLGVLLFGPLG